MGFRKKRGKDVFSTMLDAGYWMPEAGCWILDAGYWMHGSVGSGQSKVGGRGDCELSFAIIMLTVMN